MSITDELRKWVKSLYTPNSDQLKREACRIADRIDAEHEKLMQEQPFTIDMVQMTDENMAEHGWIRLPKDADGQYINIGDELDGYGYPKGGAYCKAIVNDVTILAGPIGSFYKSWLMWDATEVCHHHEPTVEDVLREFVTEFNRDDTELCDEEIIERFAAKLQLRNDEE